MFEKILCCYDYSEPSHLALEWALELAESFRSRLDVLHVIPKGENLKTDRFLETYQEKAQSIREEIDRTVRRFAQKNPKSRMKDLEIEVVAGKPAVQILRHIQRESPDLVVLGSHGRKGLSHAFLGSVAEKIARHSPVPVWVAKRNPHQALRVLVPVDPSESTEETLPFIQALSHSLPTEGELLYVLPLGGLAGYPPEALAARGLLDLDKIRSEAREELKKIRTSWGLEKFGVQLSEGFVASEICTRAADFQADLVVIPTHGRTGLPRLFLGSVAEQVIRYSPCSILSFCPKKSAELRKVWIEELEGE